MPSIWTERPTSPDRFYRRRRWRAVEAREKVYTGSEGHIAVASARFPAGTHGSQIDALARLSLWEAGLDYDHGTGHGVGVHLGVHEGPQRISKLGGGVPMEPGMILSNEPLLQARRLRYPH